MISRVIRNSLGAGNEAETWEHAISHFYSWANIVGANTVGSERKDT